MLTMAYFVRAFCASENIPSIQEIEVKIRKQYPSVRLVGQTEKNGSSWQSFELFYKEEKKPISVSLNKEGDADGLLDGERNEFMEEIGKPGLSLAKRKVLKHLKNTKYIVASQLFTSDIDDDGYTVNGVLMDYLDQNFEAMIRADGEGFYKSNRAIL